MAGKRQKRGGRVTQKGDAGRRGRPGRLSVSERMGLEDIFRRFLDGVTDDLGDDAEPLVAEMWVSQAWSIWVGQHLVDADPIAVFAGGFISYAAAKGSREALMVLRGLSAVAPEPYASRARRAADRLARAGVVGPSWTSVLGAEVPTSAWLSFDPVDDDGVSVMVGFDGPAGEHTLGLYIDHNLGGIAKDAFAVPITIEEVLARLVEDNETDRVEYREIPVAEAAARWAQAFEMTDTVTELPVSEDMSHMRALLLARLSRMRAGKVPAERVVGPHERERILVEFLESDESIGLFGVDDEEIEQLALQAMTFSLDCVVGTPLRFSPVMVEIFCLHWAPRKMVADEDAFTLLPDALAAWIRFVGRRRVIPEGAIAEAVEAVYGYAHEMIELSQDPATWGPAKTIGLAVLERGIDVSDQSALDDFIAEVNREGGIDVLAHSLVGPRAPSR